MANERIKMITMQIKNGVCLLCIFALMLLFAACFSLHTTQAEVRSFSVILLLVIGLLLMSGWLSSLFSDTKCCATSNSIRRR